jgi:hypothetical protein
MLPSLVTVSAKDVIPDSTPSTRPKIQAEAALMSDPPELKTTPLSALGFVAAMVP